MNACKECGFVHGTDKCIKQILKETDEMVERQIKELKAQAKMAHKAFEEYHDTVVEVFKPLLDPEHEADLMGQDYIQKLKDMIENHDCHHNANGTSGCECDKWVEELRALTKESLIEAC